ncbi:hypothetical protein [Crocosphaera sp.]|uniref:hypothetical protein n=1 Tax=Crocosphaera sp. TaxID=2729996 RepID=UPI003F1F26C9|nr:hypothetical protein [Crocosphaera sp.]
MAKVTENNLKELKDFSYVAISLAVASVFSSASVVNAATFSFSFSDENLSAAGVPGTVEGTIELPDGDGIFAANSVVVTSSPAEVSPPNGTDFFANAQLNSFEVIEGEIINSNINFSSSTNNFILSFFGSSFATLTNQATADIVQSNINSVNFTPVAVTTSEPSSVITLMTIGVLGLTSKLKKKS